MAGNDNERTFVPAEIDVLEDALEQAPTSVLSLPSTLDDDARARIHDVLVRYRAIEHHARAMLVAEPPASVLADVIAQARAAVATPSVAPTPQAERTPSFWSRMKALWIVPTLAGVGATALVLVMVNRSSDEAAPASAEAATRVAANDRPVAAKADQLPPLAQAEGRATQRAETESDAQRGQGVVDDVTAISKPAEDAKLEEQSRDELRRSKSSDEPAKNDPAPAVDPFAGGEPSPRPEPKATPPATKKPAKPASGAGGSSTPGGPPSPTRPSAGPKAPAADNAEKEANSPQERLSRADAARHRGDCSAARPDYDVVVETGTSKQRARARAGIALCLEQSGDVTGARSLIDRARKDDAQIDAWVDAER